MNITPDRNFRAINWFTVIMFALGFWLSSSLLIDTVIIPGLSAAGMMVEAGFASAGFLIFGIFNRIELICGALVLTGFLILRRYHLLNNKQDWAILLSGILLAIAFVYTYILTPQMSGLGLNLNLFDSTTKMSAGMTFRHEIYWTLEVMKLAAGATLLRWCYRRSCLI